VALGYRTVVGLGSNLGDRRANLEGAVRAIEALPGVGLLRRSSLWETSPVGGPPQRYFYNGAVLLAHEADPLELLGHLEGIERRFGRTREVPNGPRTLDLDVLWIEGVSFDHPRLQVPHPRLHERAFALAPLLEIVPAASSPETGVPYGAVLARLGTGGLCRLGPPLDASQA
jgi:2-amino-4-hydroxy-6-hydroxymethyldihydropteridine diphosphokinase